MIHWQANSVFFYASLVFYIFSALGYLIFFTASKKSCFGEVLLGIAFAANSADIVFAWIKLGQPPFQTLYQSLIFFAWSVCLIYFVAKYVFFPSLPGIFSAVFSGGALVFALLKADSSIAPLPPALQSIWFVPHVMFYFFGYGAMFISFITAVIYLFKLRKRAGRKIALTGREEPDLENTTYKTIKFGFLLLSCGLVIGAIWAEAVWSAYWSWDPKENWALITWFIYLAYLHLRRVPEWRGKSSAILAIIGFLAVLFTYLGVNVLPTIAGALHAYQ